MITTPLLLDLLIVVPIYNEAPRLRKNINEILVFFEKTNVNFQVLLAVDPSPDDSVKISKELSLENKRIEVSTILQLNEKNQICDRIL